MLKKPQFISAQRGMTLIETLVALVIGLVVVGAMVGFMASSLAAGSRSITKTHLQQQMRSVMLMITRDIRRANYNAEAILCFGNIHCGTDGTFPNGLPGDITLNDANNCVIFELDRDHDGDPTENAQGGFRLRVNNNIGRIQMWTGGADLNTSCTSTDTKWVDVTDPDVVDVDEFLVCEWMNATDPECHGLLGDGSDDPNMPELLSYEDLIDDDGIGNLTYQRVRKLQIRMTAQARSRFSFSTAAGLGVPVTLTLIDRIRIRNDIIVAGVGT